MSSPQEERDRALSLLESKVAQISKLSKECYLKYGKGAFLIFSRAIINGDTLLESDYKKMADALDMFDDPESYGDLSKLINKYNPKTEAIIIVVTSSNATWFVTVELKRISNGSYGISES